MKQIPILGPKTELKIALNGGQEAQSQPAGAILKALVRKMVPRWLKISWVFRGCLGRPWNPKTLKEQMVFHNGPQNGPKTGSKKTSKQKYDFGTSSSGFVDLFRGRKRTKISPDGIPKRSKRANIEISSDFENMHFVPQTVAAGLLTCTE